jgi:hypothetical protein
MLSFERSSRRTRPINLCCIIIVVALSKDEGEHGLEKKNNDNKRCSIGGHI